MTFTTTAGMSRVTSQSMNRSTPRDRGVRLTDLVRSSQKGFRTTLPAIYYFAYNKGSMDCLEH